MKRPFHYIIDRSFTAMLMFLIVFCGRGKILAMDSKVGPDYVSCIPDLLLKSHSFDARQRSTFSFGTQTEFLERGLTLVHVQDAQTIEYKTFDTYASIEDTKEFVRLLTQMTQNKSPLALLVHDSAAGNLGAFKKQLEELGFILLSNLKGRQAYIMHNLNGTIYEQIDDNTITKTVDVPSGIMDEHIYFPKVTYDFEPHISRYIAHAGGEVDGVLSTNTKEALDQSYRHGFRFFELDIAQTSDGHLVAVHDWDMWSRFTDYTGTLPPTHAEFLRHKIYGNYTSLDMEGINSWFKAHPEATLVTDKFNDPVAFAGSFIDRNRLIMELFSAMAVEEASRHGIRAMISQEPLLALKGDKINFLKVNNVGYVAVSRRIVSSQNKLMLQLKNAGIRVYVFNVNFDPGKDETYVHENELGLVYGMYADKWMPVMDSESSPN